MNADRTLLTDAMWTELSPLLPGQADSCGVTATDTRGFVEAVLWLGRTGAPWRDLPPQLGQWHRVYARFARWRDKGVWEKVTAWLIRNKRKIPHSRQRQLQVDSTSIRVHQQGRGAEKNGDQGLGRSRGGNTSKIHLVADGAGKVLGWEVTAGTAGDAPQAADLLAPWRAPAQEVVADAAYDSDALRAVIAEAGANAVIKSNPRRKNKPYFDPVAYRQRHHIEQTFSYALR